MRIFNKLVKLSIFIASSVSLLSLAITTHLNRYAQRLTVIDDSIRELAISKLEIDSQIALFRSSVFLTKNLKQRYVNHPDKVIYITPDDVSTEIYSYKP